jgi:hypothetical protein
MIDFGRDNAMNVLNVVVIAKLEVQIFRDIILIEIFYGLGARIDDASDLRSLANLGSPTFPECGFQTHGKFKNKDVGFKRISSA